MDCGLRNAERGLRNGGMGTVSVFFPRSITYVLNLKSYSPYSVIHSAIRISLSRDSFRNPQSAIRVSLFRHFIPQSAIRISFSCPAF
jgi:hypothetical protein